MREAANVVGRMPVSKNNKEKKKNLPSSRRDVSRASFVDDVIAIIIENRKNIRKKEEKKKTYLRGDVSQAQFVLAPMWPMWVIMAVVVVVVVALAVRLVRWQSEEMNEVRKLFLSHFKLRIM